MLVSSDARRDRARELQGVAPRRDYIELAERLRADVFDIGSVVQSGWGRRLVRCVGRGPGHSLLATTKLAHYDVVFSDSEHVGLFVGLLLRMWPKRPRHVVLAHHLTPGKKHAFVRLGRAGIDTFLLHSQAQREFVTGRFGLPAEMLQVLPYQVDTEFWRPWGVVQEDIIATAGLECRDYQTLLQAVKGLPLKLRIGAASNWSRKENTLSNMPLTDQVSVTTYDYVKLRELYARSRFVVVPLLDVDFQAGITTILEAMAMSRAVITTATKGHCGAVLGPLWQAAMTEWPKGDNLETSTGIYVSPGDVSGLQAAMRFLSNSPMIARRLGENGRQRATLEFTIELFAQRFADAILGIAPDIGVQSDLHETDM